MMDDSSYRITKILVNPFKPKDYVEEWANHT